MFKIVLMGPLAQVGLALATAIGAWINLGLVMWFAARAGLSGWDGRLRRSVIMLASAGCVIGIVVFLGTAASSPPWWRECLTLRDETALRPVGDCGAIVYGGLIAALLGRRWLAGFRPRRRRSHSSAEELIRHCAQWTNPGAPAKGTGQGRLRAMHVYGLPLCV